MTVTKNRFSTSSSGETVGGDCKESEYEQLTHDTRDRLNSPAQSIEIILRSFRAIHLLRKLLGENDFSIEGVQMSRQER